MHSEQIQQPLKPRRACLVVLPAKATSICGVLTLAGKQPPKGANSTKAKELEQRKASLMREKGREFESLLLLRNGIPQSIVDQGWQ